MEHFEHFKIDFEMFLPVVSLVSKKLKFGLMTFQLNTNLEQFFPSFRLPKALGPTKKTQESTFS
jgi:hypothetical protein